MKIRPFAALLIGFLLSGCAATTPPPRLSAVDPADARAPEAQVPPPSALLQLPAREPTTPSPAPEPMTNEHHPQAAAADAAPVADVYSCPMHPQVRESKPGKCSICGATLVKQSRQPKSEPMP
jgi:hypothetical protein